jgi:hypothetical protein
MGSMSVAHDYRGFHHTHILNNRRHGNMHYLITEHPAGRALLSGNICRRDKILFGYINHRGGEKIEMLVMGIVP